MPLYGYGLLRAPWVLEDVIKRKDLVELIKVLRSAKRSFTYSQDKVFLSSINDNLKVEESYISSYDNSKTNLPVSTYQLRLEDLIYEANKLLIKSKKFPNYKFDIMGSWTIGRIIIMKRNKK